jgi:archaellin
MAQSSLTIWANWLSRRFPPSLHLLAEDVYVLPKANVEGVSLEDNKVALTLNDDQKVINYFNTCLRDVYKNLKIISTNLNWPCRRCCRFGRKHGFGCRFWIEIDSNFGGYRVNAEL